MLRPLLLSAGSRGDFEPLTALAAALSESPEVELTTYFVQPDYIASVPAKSENLKIVQLAYGLPEMQSQFVETFKNATTGATGLEITWSGYGLMVKNLVLPTTDLVLSTADESKCNLVMSTFCTWPVAYIVSQKLKIPFILLSIQPYSTSRYYPHLNLQPKKAAELIFQLQKGETLKPSDENMEVSNALHKIHFLKYTETLDKFCAKFDLPPVTLADLNQITSGTSPNMITISAVQSQLVPPAPDAPKNSHTIGSLAVDYIPEGYDPQARFPELCAFLKEGEPPIVISYGSLGAQGDPSSLLRALLNGLKMADVKRAVILPGAANIKAHLLSASDPDDAKLLEWASGRVLTVMGNVQYAWLLPQCEMLFCHGGAGCTSAALHAGIPVLITPTAFDQMFFGELVKLMGVGTVVGSQGFQSITADLVAKGIQEVRSPSVVEKVQNFSKLEKQSKRAVDRAVRIMSEAARGI